MNNYTLTYEPVILTTDLLIEDATTLVPQSSVVAVQLDMSIVLIKSIILLHNSATQDFGLRGWISSVPLGIQMNGYFPLVRSLPRPVVLYRIGQLPPVDCFDVPVTVGIYYLNVQNLTNAPATFSYAETNLA